MISRNDKISIYGLYLFEPTLFDNLKLPPEVDRETVIENLVLECADYELLYPDADFMKQMLGIWSRKQMRVWSDLAKTLDLQYNPIWNKDGVIKETRKIASEGEQNTSGSTKRDVSAYNETGYHPESQDTATAKAGSKGLTDETFERVEQGNIGVTTSQEMLRQELEIRKVNLIDYIIKNFKQRFCLLIY